MQTTLTGRNRHRDTKMWDNQAPVHREQLQRWSFLPARVSLLTPLGRVPLYTRMAAFDISLVTFLRPTLPSPLVRTTSCQNNNGCCFGGSIFWLPKKIQVFMVWCCNGEY